MYDIHLQLAGVSIGWCEAKAVTLVSSCAAGFQRITFVFVYIFLDIDPKNHLVRAEKSFFTFVRYIEL